MGTLGFTCDGGTAGRLRIASNTTPAVEPPNAGRPVADRAAALLTLPRLLAAQGIAVTGLRAIAPSLEDIFIALVQSAGGAVEN